MELTILFEITDAGLCMDEHIIRLYCSRRPVTALILENLILSESSLSMWQDNLGMLRQWVHPGSDPHTCLHLAVINRLIAQLLCLYPVVT
jgi:hypothetical protein